MPAKRNSSKRHGCFAWVMGGAALLTLSGAANGDEYYIRGDSSPVGFYELFGNPNGGRVKGNHSSIQQGPPGFIMNESLTPAEIARRTQQAAYYARSGQGVVDVYTQQNGRIIWAGHGANPMPANGGVIRVYSSQQPGVLMPGASYTGNVFPKDQVAIMNGNVPAWGVTPVPNKDGTYSPDAVSVVGPGHPVSQRRGGAFQPVQCGPVPRMQPNFAQRAQVKMDTASRCFGGASLAAGGAYIVYDAATDSSQSVLDRYVNASAGSTAMLGGSSYTLMSAGQGMTALGYTAAGAKTTGAGVALGSATITVAAGTATFAASYTATRGIDYATGNRISTGLATGFWAGYETIAAPYNLWNGNDVYGRTSTAADMTWRGSQGSFWGW